MAPGLELSFKGQEQSQLKHWLRIFEFESVKLSEYGSHYPILMTVPHKIELEALWNLKYFFYCFPFIW